MEFYLKHFVRIVALFLLPVALVYGLFAAALWRSGELILTQTVVQRTLKKDTAGAKPVRLFGLAYREESRPYKHKMAAETAADVLVMGTSRSMQFRGAFFETDSFYNAGGSVPYLPQALNFLTKLPEESLPTHLLLVLDQYFYNELWGTADDTRDAPQYEFIHNLSQKDALRRFMADTMNGKCNVFQMLQTPPDVVGVSAAARGAGFYADGSYSYGTAVLHPEKSADAGFRDTLSRIAQSTNRFECGDTVSASNLAVTEQLLQFCAAHGISVTAVIPPYAPTVWHTMQSSGNYTYIEKLLPALQPMFDAYGYEVFDYTDLSAATTDEMYIDGFHGSDRVYAYICARLADESKGMGQYFDKEKLMALFEAPGNPLCVNLPDA